ncbi:MAG: hypothetical protein NTW21_03770 [Verrucomicrobia bacterium]|nr:hypothetical protein [Verrucomicrobiota bacterium]
MADHARKLRTSYPCLLRPYHELKALFSPTLDAMCEVSSGLLIVCLTHSATHSATLTSLGEAMERWLQGAWASRPHWPMSGESACYVTLLSLAIGGGRAALAP